MNGHPRHPGPEALAEFRAGVSDRVRGEQIAAHIAACPECGSMSEELGQVSTALASIPAPAMPGKVEARITSALAAEAARRAPAAADSAAPPGASSKVPLSPVVLSLASASPAASPSPAAGRRRRMTAPVGVFAAAACLVLAFVGYWLSGLGHQAAPGVAGGPAHAGHNNPVGGPPGAHRLSPALGPASTSAFVVLVSTTNFRDPPALQAQIRQQLIAGSGPAKELPSRSLVACVLHLTRDTLPELVEQARYQSQPAYVIAVPDHAWVVAPGCTAAKPQMLASVALTAGG